MEYLSIINAPIEPTPDIDVNITPDLSTAVINGVVNFEGENVGVIYSSLRIFISSSNSLEKHKVYLNSVEVQQVRGYYPIAPKLGDNIIYIVETKQPEKNRSCGKWDLKNVTYVLPLSRQQLGEQLETPQLSFTNLLYNSITLNSTIVPNATTYVFKRNGITIHTGSETTFADSGLTEQTQYNYSVIAKASGYTDSIAGIGSITTPQQGGTLPTVWTDSEIWNDSLIWVD